MLKMCYVTKVIYKCIKYNNVVIVTQTTINTIRLNIFSSQKKYIVVLLYMSYSEKFLEQQAKERKKTIRIKENRRYLCK